MKKKFLVLVLASVVIASVGFDLAQAQFIKQPLKDQDKDGQHNPDLTCWMASAANMLAAAGYAGGNSQTIYDRLTANYGWATGGLQDQALSWYLANYGEAGNQYTVVNSYTDNAHVNPDYILAELKRCQYVGIGFWWGDDIGHAITVWGDNEAVGAARQGYFSDSDRDDGGDYTWYSWADHGGGDWFLENYYTTPIADVGYVATLCPVPEPITFVLFSMGTIVLIRRKK